MTSDVRFVRITWRVIALVLVTGVLYPFSVASAFVYARLAPASVTRDAVGSWRTTIFHLWARCVRPLLGIRTDVRGRPPEPPFFLVSNHLSYVDVILLASHVRCVFLAKAEVAGWPVAGALCRSADTVFIDRESKRDIPRAMRRIERVLAGGRGVVIFPEGSSTKGAGVQRFRPSLLEAAAQAELPVSYAALSYRTPAGCAPAHLSVCWWGDMTFMRHLLALLGLPRIDAMLVFGEEPIRERDRKLLAERLHCAVEQRFQPVV